MDIMYAAVDNRGVSLYFENHYVITPKWRNKNGCVEQQFETMQCLSVSVRKNILAFIFSSWQLLCYKGKLPIG